MERFYGLPVYERPDVCGAHPFRMIGDAVYVRDLRWWRRLILFAGDCGRCGETVRSLPRHAQVCVELGGMG